MIALGVVAGCGAEATREAALPPTGTRGVTQGGAQDIEVFRSHVERGEIPGTETLDAVGFFAEHALDLPEADCGEDLCVFPSLAVAPRFDGSHWTMAYVTLGSALDPATLEREPTHVVFVVDPRVVAATDARSALSRAWSALSDDDRLSVIVAGERAEALAVGAAGSDDHEDTLAALALVDTRRHSAGIYDGLALASELIEAGARGGRIVLLSVGDFGTAGIQSPARIEALGQALGEAGVGVSVVGYGAGFDRQALGLLGAIGTGTVAVASDGQELSDILTADAETAFTPLATGFELTVTPSEAYRVGAIYGGREMFRSQRGAVWRSAAMFLGHREGAADVARGRRGGGSGFFVELLLSEDPGEALASEQTAFEVVATYTGRDGDAVEHRLSVVNPFVPGQPPADTTWPEFVGGPEKPFMMLNMYLALRATVSLYEAGQCREALGVTPMMLPTYTEWTRRHDDVDIAEDWALLRALTANVGAQCEATGANTNPVQPVRFSGGCFGL